MLDIPYFMDICQEWEINDILENIPYTDRNLWESQRLNAYITAQANSTKKLQMKDICKFKWEEETSVEEKEIEITNDEIKRLKELSKKWEK